jgi:hypothetical protein
LLEDGSAVVGVEGGAEALRGYAAACGVAAEHVEGEVAEDGEVFRSVVGAGAVPNLVEVDVDHPVDAILDAPVGADGDA